MHEAGRWPDAARRLLDRIAGRVVPVAELAAEHAEQRVMDRLAALVGLEVPLGYIGGVFPAIHQHAVPRAVLRRA